MKYLFILPFLLACTGDQFTGLIDGDEVEGDSGADASPDVPDAIAEGGADSGIDASETSVIPDGAIEAEASSCTPETLAGPTLTTNTSAGASAQSGLKITALSNTTLTSFIVQNQGSAGVVTLTDTSLTVLQSTTIPASSSMYKASVSWPLTAGTTYYLLLTGGTNGRYVTYSSYPIANSAIKVIESYWEGDITSAWFTFTSLVSCP